MSIISCSAFLHCVRADGVRSDVRSRVARASASGCSSTDTASGLSPTAPERAESAFRTSCCVACCEPMSVISSPRPLRADKRRTTGSPTSPGGLRLGVRVAAGDFAGLVCAGDLRGLALACGLAGEAGGGRDSAGDATGGRGLAGEGCATRVIATLPGACGGAVIVPPARALAGRAEAASRWAGAPRWTPRGGGIDPMVAERSIDGLAAMLPAAAPDEVPDEAEPPRVERETIRDAGAPAFRPSVALLREGAAGSTSAGAPGAADLSLASAGASFLAVAALSLPACTSISSTLSSPARSKASSAAAAAARTSGVRSSRLRRRPASRGRVSAVASSSGTKLVSQQISLARPAGDSIAMPPGRRGNSGSNVVSPTHLLSASSAASRVVALPSPSATSTAGNIARMYGRTALPTPCPMQPMALSAATASACCLSPTRGTSASSSGPTTGDRRGASRRAALTTSSAALRSFQSACLSLAITSGLTRSRRRSTRGASSSRKHEAEPRLAGAAFVAAAAAAGARAASCLKLRVGGDGLGVSPMAADSESSCLRTTSLSSANCGELSSAGPSSRRSARMSFIAASRTDASRDSIAGTATPSAPAGESARGPNAASAVASTTRVSLSTFGFLWPSA
mmetsp:Transcript_20814/g.67443  ORF Transcript_20814/g.67443 Transcript_20814/m.67443 type:complete len:628 (-) Transcript_20814:2329-4212(-)